MQTELSAIENLVHASQGGRQLLLPEPGDLDPEPRDDPRFEAAGGERQAPVAAISAIYPFVDRAIHRGVRRDPDAGHIEKRWRRAFTIDFSCGKIVSGKRPKGKVTGGRQERYGP